MVLSASLLLSSCLTVLGIRGPWCAPEQVASPGILTYGDSKTAALTFQPILKANLSNRYDIVTIGRSSATVAVMHGTRVADLASDVRRPRGNITAVLINLGVNDVSLGLPAEAAWEANLGAILDLMHSVWPTARIYVMRPWYRTGDVGCDTVAAWIDVVLSTRSGWAFAGPDERTWLKGADDGATMTTDGTHYSTAGAAEAARQWQTVLGY